jgi:hypothetical protein
MIVYRTNGNFKKLEGEVQRRKFLDSNHDLRTPQSRDKNKYFALKEVATQTGKDMRALFIKCGIITPTT